MSGIVGEMSFGTFAGSARMAGMATFRPKRIGFIGFEGVTALDLTGPAEAFAVANVTDEAGHKRPGYEIVVIGVDDAPFTAESGIAMQPRETLKTCGPIDTVVVPGGFGLRRPETNARVVAWLKRRARTLRRIASVCTGIYGLAPTGLLDGRRATTHWAFAEDVARKFPQLTVDADAVFIKQGNVYTSAGITAGIDLAVALIQEDFGPQVALGVARELVMYLKRPGGQEQFSEPLKFQIEAKDGFADLVAWMNGHLRADLSVEALARRVSLCPRHFARRFRAMTGRPPATYVEELRLNEARSRLASTRQTVEQVAASVGFSSADVFRRAFERRYRVTPTLYRQGFGSGAK